MADDTTRPGATPAAGLLSLPGGLLIAEVTGGAIYLAEDWWKTQVDPLIEERADA